MANHKRRPLPNWLCGDLDTIIMASSTIQREIERLLLRLERGETQAAAFPLARIAQENATIRETATIARAQNTTQPAPQTEKESDKWHLDY